MRKVPRHRRGKRSPPTRRCATGVRKGNDDSVEVFRIHAAMTMVTARVPSVAASDTRATGTLSRTSVDVSRAASRCGTSPCRPRSCTERHSRATFSARFEPDETVREMRLRPHVAVHTTLRYRRASGSPRRLEGLASPNGARMVVVVLKKPRYRRVGNRGGIAAKSFDRRQVL